MENFLKEPSVNFVKSLVVGRNEICDFSSIQEALDSCRDEDGPLKITVLSGEYYENITVYQSNISLIGIGSTKLIGNRYALQKDEHLREIGTFQSATLFINGENIRIENLEIINDAGPGEKVGQALALYNEGNNVTFINCSFKGYQDTICLGPLPEVQKNGQPFSTPEIRTIYEENKSHFINCYIEGTVDFIFGGGEAVFQGCEIKSLKRPLNREGYITAASTSKNKKGFYFYQCLLTADADVKNVFLGRPWRPYAKTTFANCMVGVHIHHDRWNDWGNIANRKTVTYKENNNRYIFHSEMKTVDWIDFIQVDL
ncbi:pectinesterase family protein [Neobacillus sp. YX16]|uniref:pectinesterase family protein n=1 Tax=Neobacillus sp. YX16 TaxID=3047874 RepID=UPI0024C2A068|nr:pectinesterase family protein [Neobacillus sp. YX16]WHZ05113.1 pectinesterase family protein [Neobacillus sp. YX16]